MKLTAVVVDDSEINLTLFRSLLAKIDDLDVELFDVSQKALTWCTTHKVDIIIVDYMMPAPDGLSFICSIRNHHEMRDIPVVMITANDQKKVRYDALEVGATDFLTKPIDKNEFIARIRNMVTLRRSQKLLADRAALLAEEVAAATAMIAERERETIFRLSKAAEYRDPETGGHIMRMAHISRLIGAQMGLSVEDQRVLFEAAPMHDIGKVGIPDHILLKPGKLDQVELALMRRHAEIGHAILHDSNSAILKVAAMIALTHHEKFDGTGYPNGLKGEEITLYGRIVPVADVFDALTSIRPYKDAWPLEEASKYIVQQSGKHFDPACVAAFLAVLDKIIEIREQFPE